MGVGAVFGVRKLVNLVQSTRVWAQLLIVWRNCSSLIPQNIEDELLVPHLVLFFLFTSSLRASLQGLFHAITEVTIVIVDTVSPP